MYVIYSTYVPILDPNLWSWHLHLVCPTWTESSLHPSGSMTYMMELVFLRSLAKLATFPVVADAATEKGTGSVINSQPLQPQLYMFLAHKLIYIGCLLRASRP